MKFNYYSLNHSSEFNTNTNLIERLHKLTALKFATSFLFFFNVYFKKEKACASKERGKERERENAKQAPHDQCRA